LPLPRLDVASSRIRRPRKAPGSQAGAGPGDLLDVIPAAGAPAISSWVRKAAQWPGRTAPPSMLVQGSVMAFPAW